MGLQRIDLYVLPYSLKNLKIQIEINFIAHFLLSEDHSILYSIYLDNKRMNEKK